VALHIVEEHGLTDVGRQRKTNEDSYVESSPIFAVADGMGGARAGEVASRIAVEAFEEDRDHHESHEAQLAAIACTANRRIHDLAREDESRAGMGTTLTALMVGESEVAIGHVGDSRAYRFREEALERLTTDHSLVEEMVRKGQISPEEAEVHPQRSIITRALGPEPDVDVETFTTPGRGGDVYLICSDGLTGMVPERQMKEVLHARETLADVAQELVNLANANGGRDNITVVLFRLGEERTEAAEDDTGEIDPAAVAAGVAAGAGAAGPQSSTAAPAAPEGETFLLDAATAEHARRQAGARRIEEHTPERPHGAAATTAQGDTAEHRPAREAASRKATRRRRGRPVRAALVTVLLVGLLCVGAVAGARRLFFLGTNDQGVITLYRGLPYDGPLGVSLYGEEYASAVPAASLQPVLRSRILDHQLRDQRDATDLVRRLEVARTAAR
jgi:serine/threonine protein phosphatase PrpC